MTVTRKPQTRTGYWLLVSLALALVLVSAASAYYEGLSPGYEPIPGQGVVRFRGWYHNVNNLLLHTSNMGFFGDWNSDPTAPSGEWPAGSGIEYLFAAGLWVGGVIINESGRPDTLVSAAVYQLEYYPKSDARDIIYEASEGQQGGGRLEDDDNDGAIDEDFLDGYDNDGDGLVDEDFSAISQQMFTSLFYDTTTIMNTNRTEDFHVPMDLEIRQESYAWTSAAVADFVGVEYKVKNQGDSTIYKAYVAFMIDGDIGPIRQVPQAYTDDMASFIDTTVTRTVLDASGREMDQEFHLTLGYMYDFEGGEDGEVPGYIGIMFLGHTTDPQGKVAPEQVEIHVFRSWSSGEQDPENDKERYRYMRGASDNVTSIDPPTTRPQDYRFLVSAGPFAEIRPGSTLVFQCAFVAGAPFEQFIDNAANAQRVYDGKIIGTKLFRWLGSSPPPPPRQRIIAGDSKVILEWDDYSETTPDPLLGLFDFAGYRIWKAVGWRHESEVPAASQWQLIAHFNKDDLPRIDTGLLGIGKYRYVDDFVHNGLPYWYAVTAFDDGSAEKVPSATGEVDSIPRYGSYSQAMQLVYPRSTPARVTGKVEIVPNPYPWNPSNPSIPQYLRESGRAIGDLAEYERDPSGRRVRFINLPKRSMVRIYSLAGDLIWDRYFEDPTDPAGEPPGWNLVSRNNQEIVSGIYIVHVESPLGSEVTKLIVVR